MIGFFAKEGCGKKTRTSNWHPQETSPPIFLKKTHFVCQSVFYHSPKNDAGATIESRDTAFFTRPVRCILPTFEKTEQSFCKKLIYKADFFDLEPGPLSATALETLNSYFYSQSQRNLPVK